MKNLFTLLIMLFAFSITNAQNWNPIKINEKYNFNDGYDSFSTIWVDSMKTINNDSVFFLNKIIKKVKGGDNTPPFYASNYYLEKQSQFFLSKIIYSISNDIILEENDSVRFVIKPYSNLNDAWVFDSLKNVTATVVNLTTMEIFGNIDSIKIIQLTSNDSIFLSKNYGIIRFPVFDSLHHYVSLAGIEGRNLGQVIPKFNDFFNFDVGDIFYYSYSSNYRWEINQTDKKIEIIDKEINGDTIKYNIVFKARKILSYPYGGPNDTSFIIVPDSIFLYINSNNSFLNKYGNQILANNISGMYYKPVYVKNESTFNTITKSFPSLPFCEAWGSDTIVQTFNPTWCSGESYSEIYGNNFGLISKSYFVYDGSPYTYSESEVLSGCIKSGVIYGSIIDDSVFLSVPIISSNFNYKVYPNPAKNYITIETQLMGKESYLIIYGIEGKEILSQQIQNNNSKIDISSLRTGVYFLKFITDKKIEVRKIIKE